MKIALPLINYHIPARIDLQPSTSGHTLAYVHRAGDEAFVEGYFVYKPFDEWGDLSDDEYIHLASLLKVSVWELREAVKAICFER